MRVAGVNVTETNSKCPSGQSPLQRDCAGRQLAVVAHQPSSLCMAFHTRGCVEK